ncbi:hypothetical protein B2J93_2475 [Marssonina coronariae]|uniref:GP-PDE domain-containing protein n=1 Tax=Diplocarpon coronariae TaxID=2795749 RepID=A0A218YS08_9HELO|nr:hypothetical protein B2J93_2475 [Marssonina coronariae]
MGAFKGAVEVGAHAIETDVHMSKDGVVVLSHDASLKRCFGLDKKIANCNWSYLESLRTVQEPHQLMPRLVDLLEYLNTPGLEDIWVLLDIKLDDNPDALMSAIAEGIKDVESSREWADRILLGCWDAKYIPVCNKHLPGFPITHIGWNIPYARQFLDVPGISFNMFQKMMIGPGGERFMKDVRKAGRSLFLWTINDDNSMRWCISKQVDGVITDDPKRYLEICKIYNGEKVKISLKQWSTLMLIKVMSPIFRVLVEKKYGIGMSSGQVKRDIAMGGQEHDRGMETSRSQTPVPSAEWSQTTAVEEVPETPGRGVERGSGHKFVDAQGFRKRVVQRSTPVARRAIEVQNDPAPKLKRTGSTLKGLFSIGLRGEKKAEAMPVYTDPNETPGETAAQAQARALWEEQAKKCTGFARVLKAQTYPGNQASAPTPSLVRQQAYRPMRAQYLTPSRSPTFPQRKDPNQTRIQSRPPVQAHTRKHLPIAAAEAETETQAQALARTRWEAREKHCAETAARSQSQPQSEEPTATSRAQPLPQHRRAHECACTDVDIEESPGPSVQRRESERRETDEAQLLGSKSERLAAHYRFLIRQWLNPWEDDENWI